MRTGLEIGTVTTGLNTLTLNVGFVSLGFVIFQG